MPQANLQKVLAAALAVVSVAVIVDRVVTPPPVQIIIEGGSAVAVQGETVFTLADVLLLTAFGWVGGMSALYLLLPRKSPAEKMDPKKIEMALALLDEDERSLLKELVDNGGTLEQSDLVVKTRFSESKVSRLLDRLEGRGLVVRVRQGMGNVVTLKKL